MVIDDMKNRDSTRTKNCDTCGVQYHPRKNGYQTTSRYCSAQCARKAIKKHPFKPA